MWQQTFNLRAEDSPRKLDLDPRQNNQGKGDDSISWKISLYHKLKGKLQLSRLSNDTLDVEICQKEKFHYRHLGSQAPDVIYFLILNRPYKNIPSVL